MDTAFFVALPLVGAGMSAINGLVSPTDEYEEKTGPFECGFSSFAQSRQPFSLQFVMVAVLFLPFDIEVSSLVPYTTSAASIDSLGLTYLYEFLLALVVGFIYELNVGALHID
ncbi:hypothetical protein BABINDRAFT_28396, partial [Babjeviella inositovora NRRL Y-12698]